MSPIRGEDLRNVEQAGPGTVAAVFRDHAASERAISQLKQAGFSDSDIGVAICQPEGLKQDQGWISRVRGMFSSEDREEYSSLDTPDTLQRMGISNDRTQHFQRALHNGDVLITVHAGSRQDEATRILQSHGADLGMDTLKTNADLRDSSRTTSTRNASDTAEQRIQLFGEMLRVHKERVQRGEVRLRKEVVREQQSVDVPVMHEEVIIERRPGDRTQPANAANFGSDQEIRVPVSEERVQVDKTPVLNEEVRIGKRQVQDVQHVADTVRHEEVRVENEGDVNVNNTGERIPGKDERIPGKDKDKGKKIA